MRHHFSVHIKGSLQKWKTHHLAWAYRTRESFKCEVVEYRPSENVVGDL